jgi:glycosyltransferase involved in cell wall biosynthesis
VRGFLPGEAIARELGRARFLLLPSLEDHWPLVVHEAACCGCGIVTTDGVGSRHELVTAANGWVYPRHSTTALAQCLREAAAADEKRLAAIETESLRLAAPYSPVAWAGRLRGLLERIGA